MKTNKIQNPFAKFMKVLRPWRFSFQPLKFANNRLAHFNRKWCALTGFLFALLLLTSAPVHAQAFLEWAKQAGGSSGTDEAEGYGIAVDDSGNSYVT